MTTKRQLAAAAIGLLFVYYEIFRWLPLGPWNAQFRLPVTNDQLYPDLVIGALLLWFLWSLLKSSRPGIITAAVLLSLWSIVHLFDWWIPYSKDLPQNAARFTFYHTNTQLLPVVGHHYPPDAGHAVLDAILYPTCLVTILAAISPRPSSESSW